MPRATPVDVALDSDRLPHIAASLREAAERLGTPLYVTDVATIDAAARVVESAFPDPWIRQYSVKANDVVAVVRLLSRRGFGANVVSMGEWSIATRAGIANERMTFEGIGKSDTELEAAVGAAANGRPLRWLAIESPDEAARLAEIARSHGAPTRLDVLLRLNPDVAPETQRGLAVGSGASKFGMTEAELSEAVDALRPASVVVPRGVHLHVGSQLGAVDAWRDAVRKGLALVALLRGSLTSFDTLDVGGGFPVAGLGAPSPGPERFAREVPPLLDAIPPDRRPTRLAIEPGRFLVARSGWIVARVLHARARGGPQVVIDAGMTELIRPALYGARHDVVALTSRGAAVEAGAAAKPGAAAQAGAAAQPGTSAATPTAVAGPICESTDELGTHALPALERGDLVAIRDAGAYAASLSSTYNGRPRPAQVLLRPDGRLVVARRRGRVVALG
jgi:diaminopimelate decarboxylase